MAKLVFKPENPSRYEYNAPNHEAIYKSSVFDLIGRYHPPVNREDEKQIGCRHTPLFHGNVLYRYAEHSKAICGNDVPDKTLETCLVSWGMSKFNSVREYSETIDARKNGASNCDSKEALEVYVGCTKTVFGTDLLSTKTRDRKLHVTDAQFNMISKTADIIGMDTYQLALYFFYLAVKYADQVEELPEEARLKKYERDDVNKMVTLVDEHIRTLWLDIEKYNKVLSIRGNSLI